MTKKTIVITGCSSGFGRCTAMELAAQGWHVFATVRKEVDRASLLEEATSRHVRANLTALLCDITQSEQVAALAQQVATLLRDETVPAEQATAVPPLDALLNNAGTAYGGPLELLPLEDLRAQMEVNFIAHVAVIQAFLPMLKAARGMIINVSSVGGRISIPATSAYSASKYALEAASDALRLEVIPFGVRVVIIEPSSSPTSIWQTSLQRSLERLGQYKEHGPYARLLLLVEKSARRSSRVGFPAQRFADLVVRILNSPRPRARYAVPNSAALLLFVRRFLPDRLLDTLLRRSLRW